MLDFWPRGVALRRRRHRFFESQSIEGIPSIISIECVSIILFTLRNQLVSLHFLEGSAVWYEKAGRVQDESGRSSVARRSNRLVASDPFRVRVVDRQRTVKRNELTPITDAVAPVWKVRFSPDSIDKNQCLGTVLPDGRFGANPGTVQFATRNGFLHPSLIRTSSSDRMGRPPSTIRLRSALLIELSTEGLSTIMSCREWQHSRLRQPRSCSAASKYGQADLIRPYGHPVPAQDVPWLEKNIARIRPPDLSQVSTPRRPKVRHS